VVSDWEGIGEIVWHRVAADLKDAAGMGIAAGVDMDMVSRAYTTHLAELVAEGTVPVSLVDDAVRRVLRLKFRCGIFEHPFTDESLDAAVAVTAANRALARQSAAASLVLLKNNGILPLRPAQLGRVLMTGPMYEATDALFGTWTLDGRAEEVVSVAAAMVGRFPPEEPGGNPGPPTAPWTHSDEVLYQARIADTVIALVGEHPCRSGEANSITTLDLPAGQLEVLKAIRTLGKRLVVVVFGGRALAIDWVVENADAVLWAWHPGIEGGNAVADVLFGDAPPRGRLPVTFPRSVGQVPTTYNHRSTGRPIDPREDPRRGRYQDSLSAPLFPFGFGLTYGDISYGPVRMAQTTLTEHEHVTASVTIHNRGEQAATEVVQCYIRDDVAQITRPVRELYDFAIVECPAGATREVSFTVSAQRLGYYGRDNRWRVDPGTFALWIAPDSASGTPVSFTLAP
jgi:beta-glucosidase